jgi:hypothetical protein
MPLEPCSGLSAQNGHLQGVSQSRMEIPTGSLITIEKCQLQRLIDLTARIERFNLKVSLGINPTSEEFDILSDSNREFADIIGEFKLRFPS